MASDPLWFKDAIVYQLHVRCFFDSNNDGIGDFRGLLERLDYVSDLGVDTIWLLPFYPSPLRDDGYDIADYRDIHPMYGTLRDFEAFLDAAHRRNIRVISELVVNHTSEQHPWFQAARQAPRDAPERAFYVWSDDDDKFPETRIIFTDTESSNWQWDNAAQQYYWHRFFSHQPDLNHNNPEVVDAVIDVMRFWLDMGVDGLRLDAIPYLCVREGTNNENLPETHQVLKRMRAALDENYDARMLLAEANQWPEDACQYFGDGDECHMSFHFPLMPRIYMAVAQQDRHPITDIMRQTPRIPDSCQWAVFLRNHDELTLEMVTDRERDYMYQVYASDQRMRVNVGIRRRLAPLMDNDRAKVELLNSLLMSMPGTPIVYYGDELGMGDNIYLGDRNGVRTPMQWSSDRNGGFSRADPAALYLPAIMDPVYGYQAVNVEAQLRSPSSLLNWMRRLITARKAHPAFGRGIIEFLYPHNRKVLAYIRSLPLGEGEDETILCVANLADSAQPVELDLRRWNGRVPLEMMGRTPFPPIGELPYFITLPRYGFYWFRLAWPHQVQTQTAEHDIASAPELPCLVLTREHGIASLDDEQRALLARDVLPGFIAQQRWFAAKDANIEGVELAACLRWGDEPTWLLALVRVHLSDRPPQMYFVPMSLGWGELGSIAAHEVNVMCRVRFGAQEGVLYDALGDEAFCRALLAGMGDERCDDLDGSMLRFESTSAFRDLAAEAGLEVRPLAGEQSHTSVVLDDRVIFKGLRQVRDGINPEVEVGRYLTEVAHYPNAPRLAGWLTLQPRDSDATYALGVLAAYVPNQGNGWRHFCEQLGEVLDAVSRGAVAKSPADSERLLGEAEGTQAASVSQMRVLGLRVGQLHQAFARDSDDEAFAPEPVRDEDVAAWRETVRADIDRVIDRLGSALEGLPDEVAARGRALCEAREALHARVAALVIDAEGLFKTRHHGDLHLGQVLLVDHDFQIVDFEGEVARPLDDRRRKHSPLRDVAGIMRSINYAAHSVRANVRADDDAQREAIQAAAQKWERDVDAAFVAGYFDGAEGCRAVPADPMLAQSLIDLFVLEKALYELAYELDHRPDWVGIPVEGVLQLLDGAAASG